MPIDQVGNSDKNSEQSWSEGHLWRKQDQSRMLRACAIIGGISLLIFARFLCTTSIFRFTDIGFDTIATEWPHWRFLARSIRLLEFPSWTFVSGLGQNIFWSGAFEPLTLLLAICGQENMPRMFGLIFTIKVTLCGLGTWLFCYYFNRTMAIALFGGFCWAFGSQVLTIGTWCYNFSTLAMILPFFLWAIEQSLMRQRHVALIVASAMLVFSGSFYLWYYAIVFIMYGAFRCMTMDQPWRVRILRAFTAGTVALLGVGLTGFVLLPDLAVMVASARNLYHNNTPMLQKVLAELTASSVTKEQAAEYFCSMFMSDCLGSARTYHGYYGNILEAPHLFVGTVTLFFCMVSWCFECLKGKLFFGLALVGVVLLGWYPGARFLLNGFVAPYWRHSTSIVGFLIIMGAMRGLWLWSSGRQASHWTLGFVTLSSFVGFYFVYKIANLSVDLHPSTYVIFAELTICALTLYWGRSALERRPRLLTFILILGSMDLLVQSVIPLHTKRSFYHVNARQPDELQVKHAELEVMTKVITERAQNYPHQLNRVAQDRFVYFHNEPLFFGYRGTTAYSPMNARNYDEFFAKMGYGRTHPQTPNWIGPLPMESKLTDLLGLRFLVSAGSTIVSDPQWTEVHRTGYLVLFERKTTGFGLLATCFVPEERFNAVSSSSRREAMALSGAILRTTDVAQAALPPCAASAPTGDPGLGQLTGEVLTNKKIILTYSSTVPALLVLPFIGDAGWSAQINGNSVNLITTALGLAAISVPAGQLTQVILTYQTPGLGLGASISLSCLLIIGGCVLLRLFQKRRGQAASRVNKLTFINWLQ